SRARSAARPAGQPRPPARIACKLWLHARGVAARSRFRRFSGVGLALPGGPPSILHAIRVPPSPSPGSAVRQAAHEAADVIRESILAGRIPAGARIGEVDLARQLSVSRTPIREALSRLAAEGLVELSPNRGARVTSWSTAELREIFELRLRLEPYAV